KMVVLNSDIQFGEVQKLQFINFSKPEGNEESSTHVKVKIPQGTSIGYIGEDCAILAENYGIEFTKVVKSNQQGREIRTIIGELVPAQKIKEKIEKEEQRLNDKYSKQLGIKGNLISFRQDGLYSSNTIAVAEKWMDDFIKSMPPAIILKTLEKMDRYESFIFLDKTIDTVTEKISGIQALGQYMPEKKQIFIDMSIVNNNITTINHEFLHAFDDLIANRVSTSSQFKEYFDNESAQITIEKHAKPAPHEHFAIVGSYLFSPNLAEREQIRKEAPETCKFIEELVNKHSK
ncbi:hypothetical protein, partial [Bacillus sp. 196mf]|uniref:anthrax toxin lethal factor-related metalloendopeptidase n=1 Tax=Bacillus sp. 196mf TaxID=1761754 RepID=UPI000D810B86